MRQYGRTPKAVYGLILIILPAIVIAYLIMQADTGSTAKNKYGAEVIGDFEQYKSMIKSDSDMELTDLESAIPGIVLDIRYAGTNNFTGKAVYSEAKAFLRKPVASALSDAMKELRSEGLKFKIYDAYRPYAVTVFFYETAKDTAFVASPYKGSVHNRGCAVDLTIADSNGKELEMPTPFDDFTAKASPRYAGASPTATANRDKLIDLMKRHEFTVNANEWWHYDFDDRTKFGLLDIPFEKLTSGKK